MRPWLAVIFCALLGYGAAWATCDGPPYDQFDFWLGAWHDPAAPAAEHYTVSRTAGGCAIEEVLTGANGQKQGIGLSGWDSERQQWRQLWVDKDRIVTVYLGGPAADGTVVLTSEPKADGAVALHLPEHPARGHRCGLCAACRRKRTLDHRVVRPLRSHWTSDPIKPSATRRRHAAACSESSSGTNALLIWSSA